MRCTLGVLAVGLALPMTSCTWLWELPERSEGEVATIVLRSFEKYHYSNIRADDRISQATLANYIAMLDFQRLYFTAEDIEDFRLRYGNQLDDAIRNGDLAPARAIYGFYRQRRARFLDFAQEILKSRPNLNTSREWILDRSGGPWPADLAELEELWRDQVRHELIDLILEDRSYEAARALRHHRYDHERDFEALTSRFSFSQFMNAFARSFDRHSDYQLVSRSEPFSARADTRDLYGDIGLFLEDDSGEVVLLDLFPGSPAAESGLQPGDRIVGVDVYGAGQFERVAAWSRSDVAELMRGPADTPVVLRILSGAGERKAYEVRLQRVEISQMHEKARSLSESVQTLSFTFGPDSPIGETSKKTLQVSTAGRHLKIGVVRISRFSPGTAREVERLIDELKIEATDGILVDLRTNPGGQVAETLRVAGLFLGKGPIAQWRDGGGKLQPWRSERRKATWDGPLAVLVNQFSGSGSEVLAAAIQDYRRGLVVGSRTFGKGSRNLDWSLKVRGGSGRTRATLRITDSMVNRITGQSFHALGVEPDIELPAVRVRWPLPGTPRPVFVPGVSGLPSGRDIAPAEVSAADAIQADWPQLPLAELASRQKQRASREMKWRLMEEELALYHRLVDRAAVPLNLEQRQDDKAVWLAEKLRLSGRWLDENGAAWTAMTPALAAWLQRRKNILLPSAVASAVDDPELLRVLVWARGYKLVPYEGESEFGLEPYDLALEQSARIVADMVLFSESSHDAAHAIGRQHGEAGVYGP